MPVDCEHAIFNCKPLHVMAWLSIWTADQYAVRAINARRSIVGLKTERAFTHRKESWLDTRRIRLMRGESFF